VHDARLPDAAGGHRVRLLYPAAPGSTGRGPARWLPRSHTLIDETALGIMRFIRAPLAPLLALLVAPVAASRVEHARSDPALASPPPGGWPVVLFSHGLGGSIAAYSLLCMDLASYGRVVAVCEHTDGSSFSAFVGSGRRNLPYRRYRGAEKDGPEWPFRHAMLETRLDDLDATLAALRSATAPAGAALEPLDADAEAPTLTGGLNCDDVQVAGHSFGGATAIGWALRHPGSTGPGQVLALDAWLFSLDKQTLCGPDGRLSPALPILFVDADESFLAESRRTSRLFRTAPRAFDGSDSDDQRSFPTAPLRRDAGRDLAGPHGRSHRRRRGAQQHERLSGICPHSHFSRGGHDAARVRPRGPAERPVRGLLRVCERSVARTEAGTCELGREWSRSRPYAAGAERWRGDAGLVTALWHGGSRPVRAQFPSLNGGSHTFGLLTANTSICPWFASCPCYSALQQRLGAGQAFL
jgi:dienelactone hydrolase